MAKAQELLYAVVGVGDLAFEKARNARKFADSKSTQKFYRDLVKRGRALSSGIRNSGPTKQAVAQTKAARTQVKAATTSVRKAVRANAKATKSAADKTSAAS
jgi:hypothetical protein